MGSDIILKSIYRHLFTRLVLIRYCASLALHHKALVEISSQILSADLTLRLRHVDRKVENDILENRLHIFRCWILYMLANIPLYEYTKESPILDLLVKSLHSHVMQI